MTFGVPGALWLLAVPAVLAVVWTWRLLGRWAEVRALKARYSVGEAHSEGRAAAAAVVKETTSANMRHMLHQRRPMYHLSDLFNTRMIRHSSGERRDLPCFPSYTSRAPRHRLRHPRTFALSVTADTHP